MNTTKEINFKNECPKCKCDDVDLIDENPLNTEIWKCNYCHHVFYVRVERQRYINIIDITKKHSIINKDISQFDINEIHEACNNLGHSTGWEYFDDELKTYSLADKEKLLTELMNNEEVE